MSKRQRLSAYYILARSAMAREDYGEAITLIDGAYSLATELIEIGALAELAHLRGDICHVLRQYAEAADASWDYLILMRDPRVGVDPDDLADEGRDPCRAQPNGSFCKRITSWPPRCLRTPRR